MLKAWSRRSGLRTQRTYRPHRLPGRGRRLECPEPLKRTQRARPRSKSAVAGDMRDLRRDRRHWEKIIGDYHSNCYDTRHGLLAVEAPFRAMWGPGGALEAA